VQEARLALGLPEVVVRLTNRAQGDGADVDPASADVDPASADKAQEQHILPHAEADRGSGGPATGGSHA